MIAGKTRQYVNNINMTIGLDKSLHLIPNPTVGTPFSDGNIGVGVTIAVTPMCKDYNNVTYTDYDALENSTFWNNYFSANGVGWDMHSQFVYPQFVNVPDYVNFFGEPYKNADSASTPPAPPAAPAWI